MVRVMDSLKITSISTSLGLVYWTDLLSGVLMCIMFAVQIYYLYLKTKKIQEREDARRGYEAPSI